MKKRFTVLSTLALVFILSVGCSNQRHSNPAPVDLQQTATDYAQRIEKILPDGWGLKQNAATITITRKQPVECYNTISLPSLDREELKAEGYVHSSPFTLIICFEPPMSMAEAKRREKKNRDLRDDYLRQHARTKTLGPPADALLHIPEIPGRKYSISYSTPIDIIPNPLSPNPLEFWNKAEEEECRRIALMTIAILQNSSLDVGPNNLRGEGGMDLFAYSTPCGWLYQISPHSSSEEKASYCQYALGIDDAKIMLQRVAKKQKVRWLDDPMLPWPKKRQALARYAGQIGLTPVGFEEAPAEIPPVQATQILVIPPTPEEIQRAKKIKAIEGINDQEALKKIVMEEKNGDVRAAAVRKITNQAFLEKMATSKGNENGLWQVRETAVGMLTNQELLMKIAVTSEDKDILPAFERITDKSILRKLATGDYGWLSDQAILKLDDMALTEKLAADETAADQPRGEAIGKITNRALLKKIAGNDPDERVQNWAKIRLEKLQTQETSK